MSYSTTGPHVEKMGKSEKYWCQRYREAKFRGDMQTVVSCIVTAIIVYLSVGGAP